MTPHRWTSERPRLRRALLQELAAGGGAIAVDLHARVAARDALEVAFVRTYAELRALERAGLVRGWRAKREREPLRRCCRRFALTRAGVRAALRLILGSKHRGSWEV